MISADGVFPTRDTQKGPKCPISLYYGSNSIKRIKLSNGPSSFIHSSHGTHLDIKKDISDISLSLNLNNFLNCVFSSVFSLSYLLGGFAMCSL